MTGTVPTDPGLNTLSNAQQLAATPLKQDVQSPQSVSSPDSFYDIDEDVGGDKVNYSPTLNVTNADNFNVNSNVQYHIAAGGGQRINITPPPVRNADQLSASHGATNDDKTNVIYTWNALLVHIILLAFRAPGLLIVVSHLIVLVAHSCFLTEHSNNNDNTNDDEKNNNIYCQFTDRYRHNSEIRNYPSNLLGNNSNSNVHHKFNIKQSNNLNLTYTPNGEIPINSACVGSPMLRSGEVSGADVFCQGVDTTACGNGHFSGGALGRGVVCAAHVPGFGVTDPVDTVPLAEHGYGVSNAGVHSLCTLLSPYSLWLICQLHPSHTSLERVAWFDYCRSNLIPLFLDAKPYELLTTPWVNVPSTSTSLPTFHAPESRSWRYSKLWGKQCTYKGKVYQWCQFCRKGSGMYQTTHGTTSHSSEKSVYNNWRSTKNWTDVCSYKGRVYFWCAKCRDGKGLYTQTHDTASHKSVAVPGLSSLRVGSDPFGNSSSFITYTDYMKSQYCDPRYGFPVEGVYWANDHCCWTSCLPVNAMCLVPVLAETLTFDRVDETDVSGVSNYVGPSISVARFVHSLKIRSYAVVWWLYTVWNYEVVLYAVMVWKIGSSIVCRLVLSISYFLVRVFIVLFRLYCLVMVVQYVVFGSIDAQTPLSSILTLDAQMATAMTNNDVVSTSSLCITHRVAPQRSWEGGRPGETSVLHLDLNSKDGILVGSGKDSLKCYSNIVHLELPGFRESVVSGFRESVGHGFRESAVASGLASHLPTGISTSLASLSSSPLPTLYSATKASSPTDYIYMPSVSLSYSYFASFCRERGKSATRRLSSYGTFLLSNYSDGFDLNVPRTRVSGGGNSESGQVDLFSVLHLNKHRVENDHNRALSYACWIRFAFVDPVQVFVAWSLICSIKYPGLCDTFKAQICNYHDTYPEEDQSLIEAAGCYEDSIDHLKRTVNMEPFQFIVELFRKVAWVSTKSLILFYERNLNPVEEFLSAKGPYDSIETSFAQDQSDTNYEPCEKALQLKRDKLQPIDVKDVLSVVSRERELSVSTFSDSPFATTSFRGNPSSHPSPTPYKSNPSLYPSPTQSTSITLDEMHLDNNFVTGRALNSLLHNILFFSLVR